MAALLSSREHFQHQYKASTVAYELFADDDKTAGVFVFSKY
jgi:hypothetical protein